MTEHDDEMQTDLEREALARVCRLVSGEATLDDLEEIERWRGCSPGHAEAFAFATRLWSRLGPAGLNVLSREDERLLSGRLATTSPAQPSRRAMLAGAGAIAASVAYVGVAPPLDLWPSVSELIADCRTAVGEHRRLTLADGAFAELNTRTSIAFRSTTERRDRIELVSGEAVVSAGRELQSSLTVVVGDGQIVSSRSTRFNVRYDGRAACGVSCLEGVVRVERRGASVALEAGRHVAYAGQGLDAPQASDPDVAAAWLDGLLVFHQRPLSEVVAEINRYRPGKIVLLNAELGRRPVNARFRIANVDEIMSLAQRVFGAQVRALPGGIVILS